MHGTNGGRTLIGPGGQYTPAPRRAPRASILSPAPAAATSIQEAESSAPQVDAAKEPDTDQWQAKMIADFQAAQKKPSSGSEDAATPLTDVPQAPEATTSQLIQDDATPTAELPKPSPPVSPPVLKHYGSVGGRRRSLTTGSPLAAVAASSASDSVPASPTTRSGPSSSSLASTPLPEEATPAYPTCSRVEERPASPVAPIEPPTPRQEQEEEFEPVTPLRAPSSKARPSEGRRVSRRGFALEEESVPGKDLLANLNGEQSSSTSASGDNAEGEEVGNTPTRRRRGILLPANPTGVSSRRSRRAASGSIDGGSVGGDTSSLHSSQGFSVAHSSAGDSTSAITAVTPMATDRDVNPLEDDGAILFDAADESDAGSIKLPPSDDSQSRASFESGRVAGSTDLEAVASEDDEDVHSFRDNDSVAEEDWQDGATSVAEAPSTLVGQDQTSRTRRGYRSASPVDLVSDAESDNGPGDYSNFADAPISGGGLAMLDSSLGRSTAIPQPTPPPLPSREANATRSSTGSTLSSSKPSTADQQRARTSSELSRLQQERDDWEKHILEAEWEELEVARYLNEFGRNVHEVRSISTIDPVPFAQAQFPIRYDWTTYHDDGSPPTFNAVGYYAAWLTALVSYISPSRMVDLQRGELDAIIADSPEEFRWQALKANGERLYLSALPLYESIGTVLRRTWRWESKLKTSLALVTYGFVWYRGLLMSSAIFGIIMTVLSLKQYPPKPDTLREILARQRRRDEEARKSYQRKREEAIAKAEAAQREADQTTLAGTAMAAAETLMAPERRTRYSLAAEATRNYGLQVSVLAGALADGHERAKNFALWRSHRATWRLMLWLSLLFFASLALTPTILVRVPGLALGIVFFIIGPIAEYKPQWLGLEWSNPFDWIFAGVPNDSQYSMEILRLRAARGKPLISDQALLLRADDFSAAIKIQEDDEPGVAPGGNDSSTDAPIGGVPAAGTASNKVNWSKWADRVMKGKTMAIRSSEMLAGSRSLALPRLPISEKTPESGYGSAFVNTLSKGVNLGLQSIEARSAQAAKVKAGTAEKISFRDAMLNGVEGTDEADVDGTYWGLYEGCCGHLVITPRGVLFRSLFAKRPRGKRGTAIDSSSSTSLDQPLLDPNTGDLTLPASELERQQPKVKVLLEFKLDDVRGLKKLDGRYLPYGSKWNPLALDGRGEGLAITLEEIIINDAGRKRKEKRVVEFAQVMKRNEAFNRLVALAPQQWKKIY